SDEVIRYAEPSTGGEAFIPRRGSRARSIAVLREAASWYGLSVGPAAPAAAPAPVEITTPPPAQTGVKLVGSGDGALFGTLKLALRTGELRWEVNEIGRAACRER